MECCFSPIKASNDSIMLTGNAAPWSLPSCCIWLTWYIASGNHRKTQVTRLNFSGKGVRNFFDVASRAGCRCKDSAYERTMGCSYHSPIRIPHRISAWNVWGVWQPRLSYTDNQDFADASKGTSGVLFISTSPVTMDWTLTVYWELTVANVGFKPEHPHSPPQQRGLHWGEAGFLRSECITHWVLIALWCTE